MSGARHAMRLCSNPSALKGEKLSHARLLHCSPSSPVTVFLPGIRQTQHPQSERNPVQDFPGFFFPFLALIPWLTQFEFCLPLLLFSFGEPIQVFPARPLPAMDYLIQACHVLYYSQRTVPFTTMREDWMRGQSLGEVFPSLTPLKKWVGGSNPHFSYLSHFLWGNPA